MWTCLCKMRDVVHWGITDKTNDGTLWSVLSDGKYGMIVFWPKISHVLKKLEKQSHASTMHLKSKLFSQMANYHICPESRIKTMIIVYLAMLFTTFPTEEDVLLTFNWQKSYVYFQGSIQKRSKAYFSNHRFSLTQLKRGKGWVGFIWI